MKLLANACAVLGLACPVFCGSNALGTGLSPRRDPLHPDQRATCRPGWRPTFGAQPGTDDQVRALAVYDDGTGPALYAGGSFQAAGGRTVGHIARWNGARWTSLGGGVTSGVCALAVFDDGSGPALYAAGDFLGAGGSPASKIAKWDGATWTPLGGGIGGQYDAVDALAVYDDGSGPALYAGGRFTTAGGASANYVARWDGATWSQLGAGVGGTYAAVQALAVYDDGSGPALYAGGSFTSAGGAAANGIAKWDGTAWTPLGSGVDGAVYTLSVYDGGSGPALFAGGDFTIAGGASAGYIAKWDGAAWTPLGDGMDHTVYALAVHDDGSGPALFAGGFFTTAGGMAASRVAKWDGAAWSPLGSGTGFYGVQALAVYDDGGGPALFAGGLFETAGRVVANYIAKWHDATWTALGGGIDGDFTPFSVSVESLAVYDDGNGPALYAGGRFTRAGGTTVNGIAEWDGAGWRSLDSGTDGTVRALAVYDDGTGPALYAGGDFTTAGGMAASHVARWDGVRWTALGSGLSGPPGASVDALAVYDDGSGPALYAGGEFTVAGGAAASHVAKWDGAAWTPLGGGTGAAVHALAVYDDGSGPALYAGGEFTVAGGTAANRIARWDGATWTPLGSGLGPNAFDVVYALSVYDAGSGPALYAGGFFFTAGGAAASSIAAWDGTSWAPLGSGSAFVEALAVYDDGSGPALYAGGEFLAAGGMAASGIARWDGATWTPLDGGAGGGVFALTVYDDGTGPALCAGGDFGSCPDSGDSYLARWGCPPVAASCTFRGGVLGLDPPDYSCTSAPVLGSTWTSAIATTPLMGVSTAATLVVFGMGGPVQGAAVRGFELLVLPPFDPIDPSTTGAHAIPIPSDPALSGLSVATQGVRVEVSPAGKPVFVLTNAQDLVLGT